jgi:hypothetical protein
LAEPQGASDPTVEQNLNGESLRNGFEPSADDETVPAVGDPEKIAAKLLELSHARPAPEKWRELDEPRPF